MNKLYGTYRQILFISIGWWLFWIIAQTFAFHRIGISWSHSILESMITTGVLAVIGFIISNTFRYYQPVSKNFYLLLGYVLFLTAIAGNTMYFSFQWLHEDDHYYQDHILRFMPLRGMFYLLMITLMTSFFWFRNKLKEQGSALKREEETESLMREAELAKLRQQLQPHFLFNSLNSISALAGSKPEQARRMIQQLSDFLRGTLRKDDQQLVSLAEEIAVVSLYLDIEKVRFGHRLNTEIEADKNSLEMKLPALILQPIVENAVKFGLYDTTEAITISINATANQNQLVIAVRNPFDPNTARPARGTGFGLSSVQRRLYLLFARNDLLETSHDQNIFTTTIRIPQNK